MELEQEAFPAFVDVNPDNSKDFYKARSKEILARTVYAKGFPLDSTQPQLSEFFNSNFKKVEGIIMRRYFCPKTKIRFFKGSVFVTFSDIESAEEFMKKDEVIYGNKTLLRYTQSKYIEMKKKEYKKLKDKKRAKKEAARKAAEGTDHFVLAKNTATKETTKFAFPKNTVLHFVGAKGDLKREDIKARIAEIEPAVNIAYIEFQKGDNEGDLRLSKENDAENLFSQLGDGKVRIQIRVRRSEE
jgi:lupus La protein